MTIQSTLGSFAGKQAFVRLLNEALGTKFFGLGAALYTPELGGYVDTSHNDGYTYNPADGKWYTTPPQPDYGWYDWNGPADPWKQVELNDWKRLGSVDGG